jgi:predicted DNA-binding mobile mystery protein A
MKSKTQMVRLLREQLDKRFKGIPLNLLEAPRGGWIRNLREALGMSRPQLAEQLHIKPASMADLERSEADRKITLSSLDKVAKTLDARVYVTIIPNRSMEEFLTERARKVAQKLVSRNFLNMDLEAQKPSNNFAEKQISELAEELIRNQGKRLWDES